MDGKDREIITNNINNLIDNTQNLDDLLFNLLKRRILTDYLYNQIDSVVDAGKKAELLYELIITRGPSAFEHLVGALYDTGNDEIAKDLLDDRYEDSTYLKVKVTPSTQRLDLRNDSAGLSIYKMGSKPKGHALIINIYNSSQDSGYLKFFNYYGRPERFQNGDDCRNVRFGSYRDVSCMYSLLTQLGYDVTLRYNLTEQALREELDRFRRKDHSQVDSCAIVIMSHGTSDRGENTVRTFDNKHVYCDEIWGQFNSHNCSQLHGKPKLFVFQTCSGTLKDNGITVQSRSSMVDEEESDIDSDGETFSTDAIDSEEARGGDIDTIDLEGVSKVDANEMNSSDISIIERENRLGRDLVYEPSWNDFIIIFPSSPGTISRRHSSQGSLFIKLLCEVFMEHSHDTDLYKMIQILMSRIEKQYTKKYGFQTPRIKGQFSELYFNPGLYNIQDDISADESIKKN